MGDEGDEGGKHIYISIYIVYFWVTRVTRVASIYIYKYIHSIEIKLNLTRFTVTFYCVFKFKFTFRKYVKFQHLLMKHQPKKRLMPHQHFQHCKL